MAENGAYVFPPPPRPSLPVRGTEKLFPVHRIYCVGRNYAEHAIGHGSGAQAAALDHRLQAGGIAGIAALPAG